MSCSTGKTMLPRIVNQALGMAAFVLVVLTVSANAQTSTSPQGGAAIYSGPAVCVSSQSGISGSQNFQPCMDSSNNGQCALWTAAKPGRCFGQSTTSEKASEDCQGPVTAVAAAKAIDRRHSKMARSGHVTTTLDSAQ